MNQVNRRCWGLPLGGVEGCLEKMRFRRHQNELYSVKKVTGQKTDIGLQNGFTDICSPDKCSQDLILAREICQDGHRRYLTN